MERRKFISTAALAAVTLPVMVDFRITGIPAGIPASVNSDITSGVITWIKDAEKDIRQVKDFGFDYFQAGVEEYTPEMAKKIIQACQMYHVAPIALICMGPGPYIYNLVDGPSTIGLIPREFRTERKKKKKNGIDFCKESRDPYNEVFPICNQFYDLQNIFPVLRYLSMLSPKLRYCSLRKVEFHRDIHSSENGNLHISFLIECLRNLEFPYLKKH